MWNTTSHIANYVNFWHTLCFVWHTWYFGWRTWCFLWRTEFFYPLNKLSLKQSISRSLWKKVCRIEKGTPPPVVAVVTVMRYAALLQAYYSEQAAKHQKFDINVQHYALHIVQALLQITSQVCPTHHNHRIAK